MPDSKQTNRQLRDAVSILRDKGLLPKNTKLKPAVLQSSRIREAVEKYDDVISGKAEVVPFDKLTKAERKLYTKTRVSVPERGKRGKTYVVVPKTADETVAVKRGKIETYHPAGIRRVNIDVEYRDLDQYLRDLKKKRPPRDGYGYYGFRFKGGSSHAYRTFDILIDELQKYRMVEDAEDDPKFQREIFKNLEFLQVSTAQEWNRIKRENRAKMEATRKLKRSLERRKR